MTSLPSPPMTSSLPPRPRTSSSPFSPAIRSGLSVPKSRPPCGQPGRSFEVKRAGRFTLISRVPSHRASSFLEVSACTPEAPAIRKTAHPIRKATTAMVRPWRTTTPSPSLSMHPLLLAPPSVPQGGVQRISTEAYSPECVEGKFWEVGIQDLALTTPECPSGRDIHLEGSRHQVPHIVVSHRNAEPCMRAGEVSYQREPDQKRVP